ncbi:GIY-YIG nuclease family protein [Candidatus Peregrinibacteria bacterium]|jgi:putative endonuclease|nr:GIY-YIG nuclease family protein [Candidatus Peregrinibacteria bacterium]MBT4631482.1 GIY-YIG nuclease family protein [Candidatus Peregrinibacteria bacterium]MBT5516588.1 GIY-YIG nuclease family protein [Candidatus Peregrinibacteria bacterium]MBT5823871.1 GIY-YIG nuclease family protein [Candidatus Peregrinibacteria bacterium]
MWNIYILECSDGTLYTGITTDLDRRLKEHNNSTGPGAKYTKGRSPVKLVYSRKMQNRSTASQEEYRIKQLSRQEKLNLIIQATRQAP